VLAFRGVGIGLAVVPVPHVNCITPLDPGQTEIPSLSPPRAQRLWRGVEMSLPRYAPRSGGEAGATLRGARSLQ
jgi:hypothetical protein